MGFPDKWLRWIRECISTPTFSILLNGSPTGFFYNNRGIRQGDPLSPYLFVIVMEFWSICTEMSLTSGRYAPIRRNSYNFITHLLFADDKLVFSRANKSALTEIKNMLEKFGHYTGLTVNQNKSTIFFSKSCLNQEELRSIIGFVEGSFPSKYLGLPLSPTYLKPRHFSSLIDKCRGKLESWSMHTLSFTGRMELIKTVIHGTISYWIHSFQFPKTVCTEIDRMCAKFLWKGKLHTWKWDSLRRPKSEAGLGLRKAYDINKAAQLKRFWNYCASNSKWASWLREHYSKGKSI